MSLSKEREKKKRCQIIISKPFFRGLLFLLVFIFIFSGLNSLFQPVWYSWNNYDTFHGFYEEPEDTIETVFLGTSVVKNGIDPMYMYKKEGLCVYNLGSEQQPIQVSFYWLQEAFRMNPNSLKTVCLDASGLFRDVPQEYYQKAIDPMHLSRIKIQAVKDYTDGKTEDMISHLIPLFSYHSRWNSLDRNDVLKFSYKTNRWTRGYNFVTPKNEFDDSSSASIPEPNCSPDPDTAKKTPLNQKSAACMERIVDFCREHGLRLVLYRTPAKAWGDGKHNAVKSLADRHGLDFLDFNYEPLIGKIHFDMALDMVDSGHLNYSGAKKLSGYMARYLVSKCGAGDVRHKPGYEFMEEEFLDYEKKVENVALIAEKTDSADYIEAFMKEEPYTVLIAVNEDASKSLTQNQRQRFRSMGLPELSKLDYGDSYIAVIDDKKVVCEKVKKNQGLTDDFSPVTLDSAFRDGMRYTLTSGGARMGKTASCLINDYESGYIDADSEYARNLRGINIIVYDNDRRRIIDSTVFDNHEVSQVSELIRE